MCVRVCVCMIVGNVTLPYDSACVRLLVGWFVNNSFLTSYSASLYLMPNLSSRRHGCISVVRKYWDELCVEVLEVKKPRWEFIEEKSNTSIFFLVDDVVESVLDSSFFAP